MAKRRLLEMYMEAEEVAWDADVLQSLDLEYHNLNPETSLSHGLVLAGQTDRKQTVGAELAWTREAPGRRG